MTKIFNSDHSRRAMFCTLLSLLMWMVGIGGAAGKKVVPRNPIVKIISGPTYSDNGTEVRLKLWMYNYDGGNAHFIGDVYLTIDGSNVVKLNDIWRNFSNVDNEDHIKNLETSGNMGLQGTMKLNNVKIGTAQFCNVKKNQTCAHNENYKEDKWTTAELKLSFNNSFSYRPHKINVKGKWRDWCDVSNESYKDWDISNKIYGFLYPLGLTAERKYGDIMRFNWDVNYVDLRESMKKGKWVLYKKLKGSSDYEIVSETNEVYIDIKPRDFVCGATYYITFNPDALSKTPIISGLTASLSKEHWMYNDHCNNCKHYFFRYTTSDKKMVKLADNLDFGAKMLSNTAVGSGEFMIEFYDDIIRIPDKAFYMSKLNGELAIPSSVTEIGDGAFKDCTYLSGKLTLPANLKKIGSKTFQNCKFFTNTLVIPNSVTEIGQDAFSDCSRITGLRLPNNLRKIGYGAFARCTSLTGPLSIPETVKEIGSYAFYNCPKFTGDFILPSALESIGMDAFGNTQDKNRLVFQSLPKGMQNGYHDCKMRRYVNLSDASYVSDDAYAYLDGASYVRSMTNTWGSLVLPYEMLLPSDAPYSVFTIEKMTNDEVVLKRCTFKLMPGVAYIVRRDGEEKTLIFSPDRSVEIRMKMQPAEVGNLKFSGTYWAKEVTNGYIIRKDKFWNVAKLKESSPNTKALRVGPFRSWLEGAAPNGAAQLSLRIDNPTTSIDNVAPLETLNADNAEYYDLNGKRLAAPMKGVNIVKRGNKTMKVIIK